MTTLQIRLINAYAILVLGGRRVLSDVPSELRDAVELRIAEIEVSKLG
jgi:hypothetical protein